MHGDGSLLGVLGVGVAWAVMVVGWAGRGIRSVCVESVQCVARISDR